MNKGNDAYFTCFDASTGEVLYQDESLEGIRGVYASPVAANGHIYIAGKEGSTVVIKDSDTFEIVSVNTLDDPIDASPVIVGDQMFIRSHTHLYCLSNES
jgi:outer membrane protein assembly factor BamB